MTKKISCVYVLECVKTGRKYVGSTKNFSHRKNDHLYRLRHKVSWISQMQEDYSTYGEGAFVFSIIDEVSPELLSEAETYWLQRLRPEYNKVLIGGQFASEQFLEAAKAKARNPRPKQTQEHIAKRVATMKANGKQKLKRLTDEQKQHLSEINRGENNPNYGMKRTSEHKAILLDSITKTVFTFISPEGDTVITRNLTQYCKDNGINIHTLQGAMRADSKKQRGWTFIKKEVLP